MNIFKRAFLCVIAVLILALLVSCGNKSEGDANTESVATDSQQSSDDANDTSDTQTTDGEGDSQQTPQTTPDTDIRLGSDDKDWGAYNPID